MRSAATSMARWWRIGWAPSMSASTQSRTTVWPWLPTSTPGWCSRCRSSTPPCPERTSTCWSRSSRSRRSSEGVVAELREFFADLMPFALRARGPGPRSRADERYLPPQPVGVFRRITHRLRRTFPEVIGPATSLDTVVPHLFAPRGTPTCPPPSRCTPARPLLLGEADVLLATPIRHVGSVRCAPPRPGSGES